LGSAQIGVKISFKGRQPNKESAAKPLCRYVSPATALHTKRNVITLRFPSMKWSRYSVTIRKTKLSFDLFAQQHGNDGLFARFLPAPRVRHPPAKQVSKASIAKIVGVSLPPPLYQGKAVTPTPLKDIFTPIWAGP